LNINTLAISFIYLFELCFKQNISLNTQAPILIIQIIDFTALFQMAHCLLFGKSRRTGSLKARENHQNIKKSAAEKLRRKE
jgi:hypothetical protein